MSLRNGASKDSHQNPEEHLDKNLSPLRTKTRPSILKHSHSKKPPKEPSSSKHHTNFTAVRTSSSKRSYSSHPTSLSTSTTNTNYALTSTTSSPFTQREVDLLEVSAWTHDHTHQSLHSYQCFEFTYPSHNRLNTSTCPYHTYMTVFDHENAGSHSGYGSAPLERWIKEDASKGGALVLEIASQSREGCTCITLQSNIC